MKIVFDTNGNEKQKLAASYWIDGSTEQIMYGGAKYGGKSYLGANLIFGDALLYPETYYFIARESLTDLRKYTMPTINEVIGSWGLDAESYLNYNGQDNFYTLPNKSRVYLVDAKHLPRDPDFHRFGSIQMTRGWCEEIGQMNPKAIENLWLTIGRWNNKKYGLKKKILLTCNPHKGYGYINFYKPNKEKVLVDSKKFITALPRDNKKGDKDYIRSIEENPNIQERERLGFGNWEYDDDPACLISYDSILDMFTNSYVSGHGKNKYMTCDIAEEGSDRFVIWVWSGLKIIDYVSIKKCNCAQIEEIIKLLAKNHMVRRSNIAYDADGVGSFLKGYLKGAMPIANNSRAVNEENYQNLKSQLYYHLAKYINRGDIYVMDILPTEIKADLIQELEHVKSFNTDDDKKLKILPKNKVKEIIGRSPDYSDAMAIRMIFELREKKPRYAKKQT